MPTPVTNGPEGQPQVPSAEKRDTIPTPPPAMETSVPQASQPENAPGSMEQELPPTVPTQNAEAPKAPDTIPTPPGMEMADTMRASAPEAEMPPTVPTPKEEEQTEKPSALKKLRDFFGF